MAPQSRKTLSRARSVMNIADKLKILDLIDNGEKSASNRTKYFSQRKTILQIINSLLTAIDLTMNYDPIMTRSLNYKHSCENAVEIYEELYKDVLRRTKQSRTKDFF